MPYHRAGTVPRWFEAGTGTVLFEFIRSPITFLDFAGRKSTRVGLDDTGGAQFVREVQAKQGSDVFVPVKVRATWCRRVSMSELRQFVCQI